MKERLKEFMRFYLEIVLLVIGVGPLVLMLAFFIKIMFEILQ